MPTKNGKTSNLIYESLETGSLLFLKKGQKMEELRIFNSEEFGQIRTVIINKEPWFAGKDVAEALGYSNTRDALSKHVADEDKGVAKCDTLGGKQDLTIG